MHIKNLSKIKKEKLKLRPWMTELWFFNVHWLFLWDTCLLFYEKRSSERTFFIVNSKEKVMASEISLSKDLVDMKARNNHRVSVLKPYLLVLLYLTNKES